LCQASVHYPEDVNALYALLRQLSQHASVEEALYEKLWRGAIAEQPIGEVQSEWCEEWAIQAIKYQHWTQLTKAAMSLKQGARPGSDEWRKYSFWLIVAQWLASKPRLSGLSKDNRRALKRDEALNKINAQLARVQLERALQTAEANTQDVSACK